MPGRGCRIFYERLVDEFELEVRKLVYHLGLPFDPASLKFYDEQHSVATASSEQVRRPLNRNGVGA